MRAVGTKDPRRRAAQSASTARAADKALYMACVDAWGARSPKRVSEATSFAIRRFGLKNTSSTSLLALRRGHGPARFGPERDGKRAQELYLHHRFGRHRQSSEAATASIMSPSPGPEPVAFGRPAPVGWRSE